MSEESSSLSSSSSPPEQMKFAFAVEEYHLSTVSGMKEYKLFNYHLFTTESAAHEYRLLKTRDYIHIMLKKSYSLCDISYFPVNIRTWINPKSTFPFSSAAPDHIVDLIAMFLSHDKDKHTHQSWMVVCKDVRSDSDDFVYTI